MPPLGHHRQALAARPLWIAYPELDEGVLAALVAHDPLGIAGHDDGPIEYAPEVDTLLPRLKEAATAADLERIVHEGIVRWFGPLDPRETERASKLAHEPWRRLAGSTAQQIASIPDDLPSRAISLLRNLLAGVDPPAQLAIMAAVRNELSCMERQAQIRATWTGRKRDKGRR